jgi:thiol-disulfide isomerase/thioredoxin
MKPVPLFTLALILMLTPSSRAEPPKPSKDENGSTPVVKAQFSPDGKQVTTSAPDQASRAWDINSGEVLAGQPPLSADQVLAQVTAKASSTHRAVFLHFGASWCGWCKKLDAFLERADVRPVFETYFIPVKLVVQEDAKHKTLENPGADALLKKLGGPSGLPFSAFLDERGELIVNSKNDGKNIGFPAEPGEIAYFIQMMKKAAPKISATDLQKLEAALQPQPPPLPPRGASSP